MPERGPSGLLTRIGSPLGGRRHLIGITMRHGWRPTAAQDRFIDFLRRASEVLGATAMAAAWNAAGSASATLR